MGKQFMKLKNSICFIFSLTVLLLLPLSCQKDLKKLSNEKLVSMCVELCGQFDNSGNECKFLCENASKADVIKYIDIMEKAKAKGLKSMPGFKEKAK
jgi:hypothetical protein